MFSIFTKKKITEEKLANFMANSTLKLVESGFDDVIEIIENDPEFEVKPSLDSNNIDAFLLIIIAGNLKMIEGKFDTARTARLLDKIYRKLGHHLNAEPSILRETIAKYQSWMGRINHPSKNVHYAMSKAIFFRYELNQYQTEYFKNMNTPNPISLKRLDDIVGQFIFDWSEFQENFRLTEG